MEKKVTIKEIMYYKGHSIKPNGTVDISFSAMYDQITKSMEILQLLNENVKITAKLAGKEPVVLGSFMVKGVNFNQDGTSVIKFHTLTDYVEMDNINTVVVPDLFQVRMEAQIKVKEE
jgi:hypothetical protein